MSQPRPLRTGYLLNTYPLISTTFIRREILAHEAAGVPVARFAVRPWAGRLVDPRDAAEARQTCYILARGLPGLIGPALRELLANPRGFLGAGALALRLGLRARSRRLHHGVYWLEAARLKRLAAARGVDHLHAHFSTNATAVALLARRMGGPGYSFTVHGPDELPDLVPNGIAAKAGAARFVVAISDHCRDVVRAALGPDHPAPIHVVRCGIDLEDFPDPSDAAPRQGLVCVGRLCPQKAQTVLVEAMARIRASHPAARLTLIGDGESRAAIEAAIRRHGLADRITLTGWADGAAVRAAVVRARAFVLPSLAEGLPVAIMEALALRTPVISTRIAGIPELLDDTCGWIVEPGSVEDLTRALVDCLDSPEARLQAMGTAGRARVVRLHDQRHNAAALRALFAATEPGA